MIWRTRSATPSRAVEVHRATSRYTIIHKLHVSPPLADNGRIKAYLKQLQANPLRTKMLTSGSLAALQEFLASYIAKDRNKNGHYFTSRVPKMALYGALISAPLGHVLVGTLQRLFAGRTSLRAKIFQIIVSNLVVSLHRPLPYLLSY